MVTVSFFALNQERTRHGGRARSPLLSKGRWSRRQPTFTRVRQPQPGGDLRENRVETRGSARSGAPGLGSGAERAFGQGGGRREEGGGRKAPGRRGLAPLRRAHQVALGQVARARRCCHRSSTRLRAPTQASSFCPAHAPRPLPFPSKTHCGIKLLGELKSPAGQLPQLDHTLPIWICFLSGEKGVDEPINLVGRGGECVDGREPAWGKEPSLQEQAHTL